MLCLCSLVYETRIFILVSFYTVGGLAEDPAPAGSALANSIRRNFRLVSIVTY